ncbi:TetR/AcrR family transcriptional regulator [Marinibacterium sp. SX1]|uniref:TetR/AcrR family transcriptional regulator n=1 Tax=Marinibacterium sp. SX1 TaxID=3388424 RepID=UPI003D1763A4
MTRANRSESTRQAILDTGRQLVTHGGFAAMGLSALLKESGVPKGSFYHYFASKEAFGRALLRDYVDDYLARVDAIGQRDLTGAGKFAVFCGAWLDEDRASGLVSTCLVVNLGAEVAELSEGMRQVLDDGIAALTDRLAAMLREGQADGSLRLDAPAETLAAVFYAQLLGAAILAKLARDSRPLATVITDIETRLQTGA